MSERRRLHESRTAARQIDTIDDWWRTNRTAAPTLFLDELNGAYGLIRYQPDIGQQVTGAKSNRVMRVFLLRSRYHVYYQESEDSEAIEVLAVWQASRGSEPDL